ncbi:hypothetical protein [Alkalihalobacillus sp. 1P02AB]|uniref:hypothetical protein n=1 Tax=Alkalihalobacillus sp. 1P02AB TaxID=3132260 RepID=UPI0039A736B0
MGILVMLFPIVSIILLLVSFFIRQKGIRALTFCFGLGGMMVIVFFYFVFPLVP